MTLDDLIARVEAAEGPYRELDGLIAVALRWHPYGKTHWLENYDPDRPFFTDGKGMVWTVDYRDEPLPGGRWQAPHYTASLDAAMTLLEQGDWTLCAVTDEECLCTLPAGYGLEDAVHGVAATPALALTAAALRARKER